MQIETNQWWQETSKKNEGSISEKLNIRAKSGIPMEKFNLRYCDISGIDLVKHGDKKGYQLINSDLYRVNLTEAHLFNLDLSGSSLMKANFSHANLHCANLSGCNMLGTNFHHTKLENIKWGLPVIQEREGRSQYKEKNYELAMENFEQAEEIYRSLRLECEKQGIFDSAGNFYHREMNMRRAQLPTFSMIRIISFLVDLFCGYGEKPLRVVTFSCTLIIGFALIYFYLGISDSGNIITYSSESLFNENLLNFGRCLYFSIVTFTTLGYGDLIPLGITRPFAAMEAFSGSFTIALFVVVFVKKMTR